MKIFWLTIVAILAFVFAVSLTIQLPQVQTYIAGKVVKSLSEKIEGDISFEKIHLKPFTTLVLKNTLILDKNPVKDSLTGVQVDTFFRAQYIIAKFTLEGLFKHGSLHIDKAFVSNGQMNLVLEDRPDSGDGDTEAESLTRIFGIVKKKDKQYSDKELFHIRKVEIHNLGFHMYNHKMEKIDFEGGINWNDMDVRNININARELQFKGGIMTGFVDKLSFREKSGWVCNSISGSAKVGRGRAIVKDLHLTDKWSDLYLPLYMMSFSSVDDFSDYIAKIKMDGEIAPSELDFRTLQYFAPQLGDNRLRARISGKMSGYVNDFEVQDVKVALKGGGFSGKVNGRMTGIPEIETTRLNARVSDMLFTTEGLGDFISEWMDEGEELDLSGFAKGVLFSLDGKVKGTLNDMRINASIGSLIGQADADIRLDDILSDNKPLGISGSVMTEDLDIGSIIGSELIRQTTAGITFGAELGRDLDFPDIRLDSLGIQRLHLHGYDYSGVTAAGHLNKESFEATMLSDDPNLSFHIKAAKDTQEDGGKTYSLTADISKADLNAIRIDRRGASEVRFSTQADYSISAEGNASGSVDIGDIELANEGGRYSIGQIGLMLEQTRDDYRIEMNAPFAEASYSGTAPIGQFIKDFKGLTLAKELPAMFKDSVQVWSGATYDASIKFHNMMDVLAFALPGLYIESGTSAYAGIDKDGGFKAEVSSGRLAYGKQFLKNVYAGFNNYNENLSGEVGCSQIQVASLLLKDSRLQIFAQDNRIGAGFSYNNDAELENHGQMIARGILSRNDNNLGLAIDLAPSNLYINSREWNILPSRVNILGQDVEVKGFGLTSGEEAISINGKVSSSQNDTLTLGLQRFDISIINSLIPGLGIRGAMTGDALLTSSSEGKGLLVDMLCDSTYIADTPLGILDLGCEWDRTDDCLNISARNDLDGRSSLDAHGQLFLKDRSLQARVGMNRLAVGYVQPMLKDVFSEMDGYLSGEITAGGKLDNMEISSVGGRLEDGMLRIAYTNVPYYAGGTFHLDSKGVYFDDISVRDRFNGTGNVTGSINWDHFRDISFDTHIRVNNIEGIDIPESMAESFYGNIFGTGNVSITGPLSSIRLDVDAVTSRRGQLHIPISAEENAGKGTNLLKFTEVENEIHIDPYEAMMTDMQKKEEKENDFLVTLKVGASQDVEAFVEIDKASGNVLSGRGSGVIELEVSDDIFNINGDYTLTGGNYKFVAMGLVSRDFQIQDGSTIRFNGDIMESTLDIDAIYKTKASLSTLIADTTSVANRRTVECGISITDQISNPRLSFSIEIPDLDPTIKSRVESALSTEDKVQKQFLSLILSNSFLPDEQSGIVNNSSMLYSNVTEMLANQLSNIFQKLDIPLDLGLNYQPSDKGTDIFDVAVSTQLFNNRVVVNGSVGNKQYNTGGTQDVVGDLDIEIKLNRSGSFRLNLFSHSADSYTNFLDNSQRNGVGLTYQTEFNSFRQFFRNMFSSKAKRQAARLAEEEAMVSGGRVEIEIQAPENKENGRKR